jgi:CRP-like cAMP-binding protein
MRAGMTILLAVVPERGVDPSLLADPSAKRLLMNRQNRSANLPPASNQNRLLAALAPSEHRRIADHLEVVPLRLKQVLHKPGDAIEHVYFPGGGFCSLLTVLKDGKMVEVATIGKEGVVGVAALPSGRHPPPALAMVQGETDICYRMTADAFQREINARGGFHDLVLHYAQALLGFIMQSTACNAVHTVEQRLGRWLLLAQDRMEQDEFPLTQEFLAMMLGVARPTVTVVAGTLEHAGLIDYRRGRVRIVDRTRLKRASCECYQTTTALLRIPTDRSPR